MGLMMTGSFTPIASRTVAGKVRQVEYNVMDYGAVGDGSTDDTTAIQNAINAAAAATPIAGVVIPSGNFKTTTSLAPASGVRIRGMGHSTVLLPTGTVSAGTDFAGFLNKATLGSPTTDIEICDMMIDCSNATCAVANVGLKGIYLQYSTRLKIHGVYVYNSLATGIGTDFLVDSQIDRCTLDTCGVRGVALGMGTGANGIGIGTGAYAVESWIVSNCIAKNTGNNGIMMEDQFHTTRSMFMIVSNCIAYGGKHGFFNSGTSKVIFANCWGANNTQFGFHHETGDIGSLSSNFNPQDCSYIGCHAVNNGTGGAYDGFFIKDDRGDGTLRGVTMTNCVSIGNGLTGFQIQNSQNVTMENCIAHDNQSHGVLAYANNNASAPFNNFVLNGGQYYNNSQSGAGAEDGIRIGSSGVGTANNLVVTNANCFDTQGSKTQRYGISIAGTTNNSNITIRDNNLQGNLTGAFNSGAISTMVVRNNVGYNPVGQASISVTASPFTYTAGNTPEDVFINGGTVSTIVKGSTTLASATPAMVHLEPNQSVVVTYSVAPTMVTDKY